MREKHVGMILSASTMGEYDKRVVILTKDDGRFSAFARGARRPKSVLSAVTEPFCFGEYHIFRGRDSASIEEASVNNFFPALRTDLDRLYMGMYFCEVADYFTREGMGAAAELELLYRSLLALEGDAVPARLIRRIYELRMLMLSGYSPYYDEEDKCWLDDFGRWQLSETAAYTVGQILTKPARALYSFTVSDAVFSELDRTIGTFFKRNTDKEFKSLKSLEMSFGTD